MNDQHQQYLLMALQLAEEGRGQCAPNPAVGAVIVKNNQVIGRGYHHSAGKAHAEVEAFNHCQENPSGATIYVTLEPCCHWGRTPPCTDSIIRAGIKTVYFGFFDPDPRVVNRGMQTLQAAGVDCFYLPLAEIDVFYTSYHYWQRNKLPWVTAKLALSLDGKIAGENNKRVSITGKIANEFTHLQRKRADAILTTSRTVNIDNPQLNVRIHDKIFSKKIYILDRKLEINKSSEIFKTAKDISIFHAQQITAQYANTQLHSVPLSNENELNLQEVLKIIGSEGVHDLWVEAGGILFNALLKAQLINKVYLYVALKALGEKATSAFIEASDLFSSAKKITWNTLGRDGVCEILCS
jgi:diaminohydroxyphosphoribosylaminopyrimidine deaminase/5-amino-6-(5-phosphoribosylamino)uracil reductase